MNAIGLINLIVTKKLHYDKERFDVYGFRKTGFFFVFLKPFQKLKKNGFYRFLTGLNKSKSVSRFQNRFQKNENRSCFFKPVSKKKFGFSIFIFKDFHEIKYLFWLY